MSDRRAQQLRGGRKRAGKIHFSAENSLEARASRPLLCKAARYGRLTLRVYRIYGRGREFVAVNAAKRPCLHPCVSRRITETLRDTGRISAASRIAETFPRNARAGRHRSPVTG